MEAVETSRGTHQIRWTDGSVELNLIPMNRRVSEGNEMRVGYAAVLAEGVLSNSIADLVGITGLELAGCPPVPRICWDNREHHFWHGFEGSFEPRNVVVNFPTVTVSPDRTSVHVSYYFITNHVKTTVTWKFCDPALSNHKAIWDTLILLGA